MTSFLKALLPAGHNYNTNIVIERTLAGKSNALLEAIGFSGKNLIVCDYNTYDALGKQVCEVLAAEPFLLKDKPYADKATVDLIAAQPCEAIIAVGSGTINDLCKYASFIAKKDYAVFPTAPSMNGYFSANASITVDGHKQTLPAHLPKGIFCDLRILSNAPKRLIRSGLGDSSCRSTAQADWLLSHLLFHTHYDARPFQLLAPYEQELFTHADKLMAGDLNIIELLVKTLIISGLGMVIAGGSYPASQGEHLIAHTMEMKYGDVLRETYHGEQIGVTTLVMAEMQEKILSAPLQLKRTSHPKKEIENYFGKSLAESVSRAYQNKYALQKKYDALNERLKAEDSAIRDAINAVRVPVENLREILQKAEAATTAADLRWKQQDLQAATSHAKFIRDRFTFLDLIS